MEDKEGVLGSFFQEFGVPNVQIQSPFSKGLRKASERPFS